MDENGMPDSTELAKYTVEFEAKVSVKLRIPDFETSQSLP
jgi:hypothetical protein